MPPLMSDIAAVQGIDSTNLMVSGEIRTVQDECWRLSWLYPPVGVAYKGLEPGAGFYLKHYSMAFELSYEGLAAGWPSLDAGIPTSHTLESFYESIPAEVLLLCSVYVCISGDISHTSLHAGE